jgi:fumarate reductase subunit C
LSPARLYLLQRATALILAPLVLVHLGLILIAVEGGLTAASTNSP